MDKTITYDCCTHKQVLKGVKRNVIGVAEYYSGAQPNTIKVLELELIPLQYVTTKAVRPIVKAVRCIFPGHV